MLIFAACFAVALFAGLTYRQAKARVANGAVSQVALYSDRADPSALIIKVGESVQFNSRDGQKHNIGQGSGADDAHKVDRKGEHDHQLGGLQSGVFGANEGYRLQFKQTGTYDFHDHLHPKIFVKVIVYDPNKK